MPLGSRGSCGCGGLRHPSPEVQALGALLSGDWGVAYEREGDGKRRPAHDVTGHTDLAVVRCDNFPHHVESKPCPCRLGRIERFENLCELVGRNASPRIADVQVDMRGCLPASECQGSTL